MALLRRAGVIECVRVGKICVVRCPLLGLSSASATIARGHTQRKLRVEILGCCVRWIDRVCFGLIWFGARPLVRALEAKATLRSMCMPMLPAAARIDLARSPSPMPTTTQPPAGVLSSLQGGQGLQAGAAPVRAASLPGVPWRRRRCQPRLGSGSDCGRCSEATAAAQHRGLEPRPCLRRFRRQTAGAARAAKLPAPPPPPCRAYTFVGIWMGVSISGACSLARRRRAGDCSTERRVCAIAAAARAAHRLRRRAADSLVPARCRSSCSHPVQ